MMQPSTLTPAQLDQLATARRLGVKIRRASVVAIVGGWVTAVFALLTLLGSLIGLSPVGILLGIGMGVVSLFEFRGSAEVRRLDETAPRRLAINQVAFAVMLILYAAISLWQSLHAPSAFGNEIASDPELARMVGDVDALVREIMVIVYLGVMAAAVVGPGAAAIFYATRTRHIREYLTQTPQWILDLQRAGVSV